MVCSDACQAVNQIHCNTPTASVAVAVGGYSWPVYNHVTEVLLIYSAKTYSDGPFRKIRVYLISRFFSIREIRENFMLAKYTWFTVFSSIFSHSSFRSVQSNKVLTV